MILTKQQVYRELEDKTTLWIDPRQISYYAGTKWPVTKNTQMRIESLIPVSRLSYPIVKRIRTHDPYIIPGRFYRELVPVEKMPRYFKVKNLIENREDLTSTVWYKKLVRDLETDGIARHKEIELYSEQEITEFFHSYVFDLVDSMAATGYSMKKGADIGSALVGSDGRLHKAGSGNHRFIVARIVGTSSFPVRIAGIHRELYKKSDQNNGRDKIAGILEEVERNHALSQESRSFA
ncbi:MAG: hypothetical protein GVY08_09215 [Bacteroidetes bacterium]|jgi:hypothetical protein|nr:hypothetical protein [Bacteroidota bacterium]